AEISPLTRSRRFPREQSLTREQEMISKTMHQVLSVSLSAVLLVQGVMAQSNPQPSSAGTPTVAPQTAAQLDALVAPIALYPDALVAQVLAASVYPEQIAYADDWLPQNTNANT